jgi:hypothetical protein
MSNSVVIKIQSSKRTATIVFDYEKYAYDGSWQISGDSAITHVFDQEVKRPKVLYLPYTAAIDEKKGFQHLLASARLVAGRFDNTGVLISGKVIYPSSDGSGDTEVDY